MILRMIDWALTMTEMQGRVADGLLVGRQEADLLALETGVRPDAVFGVPVLYVEQVHCLRVWVD